MVTDPPNSPINVHVEDVTATSCCLKWSPPEFDGGSPVTGYMVEKCTGYSSRWTKVNKKPITNMDMTFDDLVQGDEYEMRVSAVNEAGVSKPSPTTGRFVAKNPYEVPGKPDQPTVTEITAESATILWTAPESDGGAPITNYVVEMRGTGDRGWTVVTKDTITDTTYTVTGLTEKEYEFRVTAENKAGAGSPSAPSKAVKYGKQHWYVGRFPNGHHCKLDIQ